MCKKYIIQKILAISAAIIVCVMVILWVVTGINHRLELQSQKLVITNPQDMSGFSPELQIILFGLVIVAVGGIIALAAWYLTVRKCPKCRCRQMQRVKKEILQKADFYDDGIIESTYRCLRCGNEWKERKTYAAYPQAYRLGFPASGGHLTGGHFSTGGGSFGGGSTSGGGAGGKW